MVTRNQVSRADLPRYGSPTLFEAESTPENVFLREFIMQGPKASIDMQYAENWQYLSGTVDTVFAEYNRDQPAIEYHRALAKKDGLHLLEVLN